MVESKNNLFIFNTLGEMFPDAQCELDFNNPFELLVSVVLSSQTTDKRVNIVTKDLFKKYPNSYYLSQAKYEDVYNIIISLGLAKMKTKNIILLSKQLEEEYGGKVPDTMEELIKLAGVGRKTANVVMAVGFNKNAIAVDTHVKRVSQRLALTKNNDVRLIEEDLQREFSEDKWGLVHHRLLFFGRYFCKAIKPNCENCPFIKICKKEK